MKVQEIMTRDVISVLPDTLVQAAARLMVNHGVSGLPVVDAEGALKGIVSEGDLIVRQKPREKVPWWRLFLEDSADLARQYQKATGVTVGEIMTRDVISTTCAAPIESVAAILDSNRIRRVPVLDGGRVVGIVSRGDLIKAIAMSSTAPLLPRSDDHLAEEMQQRLDAEPWAPKRVLTVEAHDGRLVLTGLVATEAQKSALETMARAVPGVTGVESHIVVMPALPYHTGI